MTMLRNTEQYVVDQRIVDRRIVDGRVVDRRVVDRRIVDGRVVDRRVIDRRVIHRRVIDRRFAAGCVVERCVVDRCMTAGPECCCCAECTFAHLGQGVPPVDVQPQVSAEAGVGEAATVSVERSWFFDNQVPTPAQGVVSVRQSSAVRLSDCYFVSNNATHLLYANVDELDPVGNYFSDVPRTAWNTYTRSEVATGSLDDAAASGYPFITAQDADFLALQASLAATKVRTCSHPRCAGAALYTLSALPFMRPAMHGPCTVMHAR
jgi:hypothetical protein